MKLNIGQSYNGFTYQGITTGDYSCDVCHKFHYVKTLPTFHYFTKDSNPDDWIKIGTACIKTDNFYTRLLGIK